MILCFILLCLGGCGNSRLQQAKNQAREDVALCQGTYPLATGSLSPLLRCEDAADMSYAQWLAPKDLAVLGRYADAVEQPALAVDQGRMTLSAWRHLVQSERRALALPDDHRIGALFALLPAPQPPPAAA